MIQIIDIFLHLDVHLNNLVNTWGGWSYAALFAVIFIETGAVVLPFLPGDSLLFAAGSIAALSGNSLNHWLLMLLFWIAALSGDSLNFFLGRTVGLKLVRHPILGRFIKEKHLQEANDFFVKHGKMAIILGRFVPIIRTLVPFTAAVSGFRYRNFIILETIAVTVWVIIAVEAGFYFGGNAFVSEHFSLVLIGILLVSALPAIISAIRQILLNKKQQQMNK
jgi:membrane-associated protein